MSVEGVTKADVRLSEKTATVSARDGTLPESIVQAIEKTGKFTAKLADQ